MKQIIPALVAVIVVVAMPLAAQAADNGKPSKAQAEAILKRTRPLAEQGVASAQYNMGVLYDQGYGVPQDYAKARGWYKKAAAQHYAKAEHNLGILFEAGHGVPRNPHKAVQWFKRAAADGEPASENNLAVMYARGEGVPKDMGKAAMWAARAAAAGNASAISNLPDITTGMPQSHINVGSVNVRAKPDVHAHVVRKADNSAHVVVLDRRSKWSQVLLTDDDTTGWIANAMLAPARTATNQAAGNPQPSAAPGHTAMASPSDKSVAKNVSPMRPARDQSAPSKTTAPTASKTHKTAHSGSARTQPASKAAAQTSSKTQRPATAKSGGDLRVVATGALNVRRKYSTHAAIMAQAHRGDKVTVLRRHNGWRYVKLASGKRGWVAGFLLAKP